MNTAGVLDTCWGSPRRPRSAGCFGVEPGALPAVLAGIAVSNGLVEAAAAAVFTAAIVSAWKGVEGASGKARLAREEGEET
ncbi:MAG: hypothetical protein M0C28_48480 [Candidatus Moduliflexus flocculans]|nr:hypothetical protein [Candidatus Moduliflexus flocculans]